MIVDEVEQDGTLNRNEGELLRNAIEFSDFEAKDILTPRVNLVALPVTATREEIAQLFYEKKFSRLLIYEDNIDNIIGVIHLKNFYANAENEHPIKEIIAPVAFTFAGEKISAIMRKLQQQRVQVAVVLDEFGGTLGIVTMEDVLETLVGDIWDEHEQIVNPFRKVAKGVFQVDAFVSLSDFAKFFNVKGDIPLLCLERLRGKTDLPFVYFISYFNPDIPMTVEEDMALPLYEVLEKKYGIVVKTSKELISAQKADSVMAEKLGIEEGDPLLVRKRFVYDVNSVPVEYNVGYYRADSFTYSIEFTND